MATCIYNHTLTISSSKASTVKDLHERIQAKSVEIAILRDQTFWMIISVFIQMLSIRRHEIQIHISIIISNSHGISAIKITKISRASELHKMLHVLD